MNTTKKKRQKRKKRNIKKMISIDKEALNKSIIQVKV
jgi:hypothetical protein